MLHYRVVDIDLKGKYSTLEDALNAYAKQGFRVVGAFYMSWNPGAAGHVTAILEEVLNPSEMLTRKEVILIANALIDARTFLEDWRESKEELGQDCSSQDMEIQEVKDLIKKVKGLD